MTDLPKPAVNVEIDGLPVWFDATIIKRTKELDSYYGEIYYEVWATRFEGWPAEKVIGTFDYIAEAREYLDLIWTRERRWQNERYGELEERDQGLRDSAEVAEEGPF